MLSRKSIKPSYVPNEETGRHENQGVHHVFQFFRQHSTNRAAIVAFLVGMWGNGRVFGIPYVVFDPTVGIYDDNPCKSGGLISFFFVLIGRNIWLTELKDDTSQHDVCSLIINRCLSKTANEWD